MSSPRISVVVPVLNRPDELRRALASVAVQTMRDFECIVVDDGSTVPLEPVVAEFGNRFRYVRREVNGGCVVTRLAGFAESVAPYATTLDSDNEMFPWALERAVDLLDRRPDADCVTGLYVFSDGLRVRIAGGERLIRPAEWAAMHLEVSDCMGAVRRKVVDRWLERRQDYFSLDLAVWFAMSLEFNQLYIDEPWGKFHEDGSERISLIPDPRKFLDMAKFEDEFRAELGTRPCEPLDRIVEILWFVAWRARRPEAKVFAAWMDERGLDRRAVVIQRASRKLRRSGPAGPAVI